MKFTAKHLAAGTLALAMSLTAIAGTKPYFVPLTQSSAVASPNHINELNSPWQVPAGLRYRNLTSMQEIEADFNQSVQRVPGVGTATTMFDMLAFDPTGKYIFIPHETPVGAGVSRYSIEDDTNTLIFSGDQQGAGPDGSRSTRDDMWENDFGAFDPARWTPWGTVIAAEEWSGLGRVVEILNPMASPVDPVAGGSQLLEGSDWRVLTSIASVSHEGINFSVKQPRKVIYFIDEDRSGSIYKLVLTKAGDIAGGGQTFVLVGDNYTGNVVENWNDSETGNDAPAVLASRFGWARWVPITGPNGETLEGVTSPFGPSVLNCGADDPADPCRDEDIRPGRVAADDVGGLPFGRPEDMTIGVTPDGLEMLYVTTTSEDAVISIETRPLPGNNRAFVRQFASTDTPRNLGFPATTGTLSAPDNLAIDGKGNVYIIEDKPNGDDVGGDVWFARDLNMDGIAESLDHFMSIQVDGAEATGMVFNPRHPSKFVIAVQHPDSVDIDRDVDEDGTPDFACASDSPHTCQGDAVWEFDIRHAGGPKIGTWKFRQELKGMRTRATQP